jgi:2-amino-4-hydroxy-6-hydroxymethyldihydropteridine diphosphokinase
MSVLVHLGLGANLGDRAAALRGAVAALAAAGVEPLRTSPVYESAYVGPGGPQPPYLDAVLEGRTALAPLALLAVLQRVETACGRWPGTHSRPRPLDLDLLLYGGWMIRHPALAVPHPRLADRGFVLQPLADLGVLRSFPALARRLQDLRSTQPLARVADLDLVGGRREAAIA